MDKNEQFFENIANFMNVEHLCRMAAFALSKSPPEDIEEKAVGILAFKYLLQNRDASDKEIQDAVCLDVASAITENLENEGLVQSIISEDGEFLFGLTERGKETLGCESFFE